MRIEEEIKLGRYKVSYSEVRKDLDGNEYVVLNVRRDDEESEDILEIVLPVEYVIRNEGFSREEVIEIIEESREEYRQYMEQYLVEKGTDSIKTGDKVQSYSEYYSGTTHEIIVLDKAHTSVTNTIIDESGRKYLIIHLESGNGSNYKDIEYPSMKVVNEVGSKDRDMLFMEDTLKDIHDLIWMVVKRYEKEQRRVKIK